MYGKGTKNASITETELLTHSDIQDDMIGNKFVTSTMLCFSSAFSNHLDLISIITCKIESSVHPALY